MTVGVQRLAPGLWLLPLASDTLPPWDHTNSYLIEDGGVGVLVDPGSPRTAEALPDVLARAGVRLLKAVLLTHTHSDHIAGLAAVLRAHDAKAYAHPLELPALEGVQPLALQDGRVLTVGDVSVRALHTPGHSPGSLSFYLPDANTVLVGDLLAGRGSTWVGLPEGNVGQYLASLDRLAALALERIGPGHGPLIEKPYERLRDAKAHRLQRETQVLEALTPQALSLSELRAAVYPDLALEGGRAEFAERSLLAHLKKLMNEMKVLHLGTDEAGPYRTRR
ncbi:MAG TPA: MBL fold metallo-hydrolase [Trueperaceae bacterium]